MVPSFSRAYKQLYGVPIQHGREARASEKEGTMPSDHRSRRSYSIEVPLTEHHFTLLLDRPLSPTPDGV